LLGVAMFSPINGALGVEIKSTIGL